MEKEEVNMDVPSLYLPGADCGQEFTNFTFNGYSFSGRFNMIRVSDGSRYSYDLLPSITHRTLDKPGGDGQYYFGTESKKRDNITLSVAFDSMDEENYKRFKIALSDKKIHKLSFQERPDIYYLAKVAQAPDIKFVYFVENGKKVYKGEGTIGFVCYIPYQYSEEKTEELKMGKVTLQARGYEQYVHEDSPTYFDATKELGECWFEYFQDENSSPQWNGATVYKSNVNGATKGKSFDTITSGIIEKHKQHQVVTSNESFECRAYDTGDGIQNDSPVYDPNEHSVCGEFKYWQLTGNNYDVIDGDNTNHHTSETTVSEQAAIKAKTEGDLTITQYYKKHRSFTVKSYIALLNGFTNPDYPSDLILPCNCQQQSSSKQKLNFAAWSTDSNASVVYVPNYDYNNVSTNTKDASIKKWDYEQFEANLIYDKDSFEFVGWMVAPVHKPPIQSANGSLSKCYYQQQLEYKDSTLGTETHLECTFKNLIENSNFDLDDFQSGTIYLYQVLKEKPRYRCVNVRPVSWDGVDRYHDYTSGFGTYNDYLFRNVDVSPFLTNGSNYISYDNHVFHSGETITLNASPSLISANQIKDGSPPLAVCAWRATTQFGGTVDQYNPSGAVFPFMPVDQYWFGKGYASYQYTLPEVEDYSDLEIQPIYVEAQGIINKVVFVHAYDKKTPQEEYRILPAELISYYVPKTGQCFDVDVIVPGGTSWLNIRGFNTVEWFVGDYSYDFAQNSSSFFSLSDSSQPYVKVTGYKWPQYTSSFTMQIKQQCQLVCLVEDYSFTTVSIQQVPGQWSGTPQLYVNTCGYDNDNIVYSNELTIPDQAIAYAPVLQHYYVYLRTVTTNDGVYFQDDNNIHNWSFPTWDELFPMHNSVGKKCSTEIRFDILEEQHINFSIESARIDENGQYVSMGGITTSDKFYRDDPARHFDISPYWVSVSNFEYKPLEGQLVIERFNQETQLYEPEILERFPYDSSYFDFVLEWQSIFNELGENDRVVYYVVFRPKNKTRITITPTTESQLLLEGIRSTFDLIINNNNFDFAGNRTDNLTQYSGYLYEDDIFELNLWFGDHTYYNNFVMIINGQDHYSYDSPYYSDDNEVELQKEYNVLQSWDTIDVSWYFGKCPSAPIEIQYYLRDYTGDITPDLNSQVVYHDIYSDDRPFNLTGFTDFPSWSPPMQMAIYDRVPTFIEIRVFKDGAEMTTEECPSISYEMAQASSYKIAIVYEMVIKCHIDIGVYLMDSYASTQDDKIWIKLGGGVEQSYPINSLSSQAFSVQQYTSINCRVVKKPGTTLHWEIISGNPEQVSPIDDEEEFSFRAVYDVSLRLTITSDIYKLTVSEQFIPNSALSMKINVGDSIQFNYPDGEDKDYHYGEEARVYYNVYTPTGDYGNKYYLLYNYDVNADEYEWTCLPGHSTQGIVSDMTSNKRIVVGYTGATGATCSQKIDTKLVNQAGGLSDSYFTLSSTNVSGHQGEDWGHFTTEYNSAESPGYGYFAGWGELRDGTLHQVYSKPEYDFPVYTANQTLVPIWYHGHHFSVTFSDEKRNASISCEHYGLNSSGDLFSIQNEGVLPTASTYTVSFTLPNNLYYNGWRCTNENNIYIQQSGSVSQTAAGNGRTRYAINFDVAGASDYGADFQIQLVVSPFQIIREFPPLPERTQTIPNSIQKAPAIIATTSDPNITIKGEPLVYISEFRYIEVDNNGDLPMFYTIWYGDASQKTPTIEPFDISIQQMNKSQNGYFVPSSNKKTILKSNKYLGLQQNIGKNSLGQSVNECGVVIDSKLGLINGLICDKINGVWQTKKTNKIYNEVFSEFQRNKQNVQRIPLGKYRIYFDFNLSAAEAEHQKDTIAKLSYHEIMW